MDALFADNLGLVHFLHRVDFLGFFKLHAPDLAEAALADHVLAVEVVPVDLFALEDQLALLLLLGVELRQIDLEAVLYVLGRFLGNCRVATVMLFFTPTRRLLALSYLFRPMISSRHHGSCIAIDAHLPRNSRRVPGVLR